MHKGIYMNYSKKEMGSTKKRSLTKGTIYEIVMFCLGVLFFWAWYGSLELSFYANFVFFLIKICVYFTNERAWKKIKWGKI